MTAPAEPPWSASQLVRAERRFRESVRPPAHHPEQMEDPAVKWMGRALALVVCGGLAAVVVIGVAALAEAVL